MHVDVLSDQGILVGSGFLREEIKDQFLSRGIPLMGHRILGLEDLALRVLKLEKIQLIKPASRRELLKQIFLKPATSRLFPELNHLRRQRRFYENLDLSIQESRSFYSNDSEREAFHGVLDETFGVRPLRHEVAKLTLFFEVYLAARELYDETRLIKEVLQIPRSEINLGPSVPRNWIYFSDRKLVSIERAMIDHLGIQVSESQFESKSTLSTIAVQQWHTSDDAAEGLMDAILRADPNSRRRHAIVFSGDSHDRLSLSLAMQGRNLIEESNRDPTHWKNKEDLKSAMIPFTLLGQRFDTTSVIEYILLTQGRSVSSQIWIKEIMNRGIRRDLTSYQGGKLSDLYTRLVKLKFDWSGKKTLEELRDLHLEFLMSITISGETYHAIEQLYEGMMHEQSHGIFRERESLYTWLERIRDRIKDFSAPAPLLRSDSSVQVFRLSQSSLAEFDHIWFYGITPRDLIHQSIGNLAFSDREREMIGKEFDCDTASSRTERTLRAFFSWFHKPNVTVEWHSSELGWNGSERESPEVLSSLIQTHAGAELKIEKRGAHPRWLPAYLNRGAHSSDSVTIHSLQTPEHLSASHLDRYSRCAFTYLAQSVWRAEDRRTSDVELWPEVKGQLLHEAVTLVLSSGAKPADAIETVWSKSHLKGLISSPRVEKVMKRRLTEIVENFKSKEDEYRERSETKTIALDDLDLTLNRQGIQIQGRPDRIDEHRDGLFIMDFKSSSDLPDGQDMVEQGYRLQMPFYALALKEKTGKPILGVQFIELTKKASRSKGVFFEKYNGKSSGSLTNTRSKLNVFAAEPDVIWKQLNARIEDALLGIQRKEFHAKPKFETECRLCSYIDLCQKRRLLSESKEKVRDSAV